MFIVPEYDRKYSSLREKYQKELSSELKMWDVGGREEALRNEIKERIERGELF
jgi:hypothetical protein